MQRGKTGMDHSYRMKLRRDGQALKPILRIGKNGINFSVIEEIRIQLKNRRLIKILALRSYLMDNTMDDLASDMAHSIPGIHVIEKKGHTLVLYK